MNSSNRLRSQAALQSLLLAALLGSLGLGCKKKSETPTAPPTEVTVAEVEQRTIPMIFDFSGTLKAVRRIEIIPRVSGYVEERYFDEGSFVEEGDLLYLIDPRPFEAALQAAKAQLGKSRADARYLDVRARRYTTLAEEQVASLELRDEAVSKAAENRAQIKLDVANVETAKLNLGYTKIQAPFAGRMQQTNINEGELVTAQETALTELVQIDPIYAIFSLSRTQMFQIQQRNPTGMASNTEGQYAAEIMLPNRKPYDKTGTVDFLSAQIDPTTDMITARAVFDNTIDDTDNMTLIPGQYVPVRLNVGQQSDAILVPEVAVMETQVGGHVFVVDAENKVSQKMVEVERAYDNHYVVRPGTLKAGDRVITQGALKVKPGDTVKPVTQSQTSGTSGTGSTGATGESGPTEGAPAKASGAGGSGPGSPEGGN
ncbi:MAG: efflux RND transporter periplasmic adaptor subunit [Myxococcota bacterium]